MKFLIDMNLSPTWVPVFEKAGWEVLHWSSVGNHDTPDKIIFDWAKENGFIIFTHDLDFGAILAATKSDLPSVIQVRTQDIMPESLAERLITIIKNFETHLEKGVLLTVDEIKSRIRILPIV
ncbi:MAG TPA: hypothetical protein ENJ95_09410 [Bacteroidetes bacterium]|nr:hypothetical protein [Bacteroidota bacterium]